MTRLTQTEKNILIQLKLQGFWGKSGSLSKKQRLNYLISLSDRGYLDSNFSLTNKAENELKNK
jgi:hypothetical protein